MGQSRKRENCVVVENNPAGRGKHRNKGGTIQPHDGVKRRKKWKAKSLRKDHQPSTGKVGVSPSRRRVKHMKRHKPAEKNLRTEKQT